MSTVYNNGIAIPHPLEMCGRGNILSVGIVKQEASVHKLPVQVIFLVDLEKGDLKLHQNITLSLIHIFSYREFYSWRSRKRSCCWMYTCEA